MSKSVSDNTSKAQNLSQPERRSRDLDQRQVSGGIFSILGLQRAIGNQAVGRFLQSQSGNGATSEGLVQRKHLSCDTPEDLPQPCDANERDSSDETSVLEEIQAKLTVSQPGDPYEQEADRVADQIMRMPDFTPEIGSDPGAEIQRECTGCSIGGSTCPKCEEEERIQRSALANTPALVVQRKVSPDARRANRAADSRPMAAGRSAEVPSTISARIQAARGGGSPLPIPARTFFESRFGLDLSGVRVHRDTNATETARTLRARAFTIGRDIMFGAGEYAPDTAPGKRLLAHELTHVAQQTRPANLVSPKTEMIPGYADRHRARPRQVAPRGLVQRDQIDHRDLTWDDFKGKVPKKTTFEAGTFSNLRDLDLSKLDAAQIETEDTGTPCKIGKKASSVFKASITFDPDDIEVKAFMDQDKSWAKAWTNDDAAREVLCKKNFVAPCEKSFKARHKKIAARVKSEVKKCEKEAKKAVPFSRIFDGEEVEITAPADCAADFGPRLEEFLKGQLNWKGTLAGEETEATTLADCGATVLQECIDRLYQAESDRLLKHEQGHFDISDAIAVKTTENLRTLAGGFKTDFEACGDQKAIGKAKTALKSYAKQLKKKYAAGKKTLAKTQQKYDQQTKHGIVEKQQAKWEEKIAEGLP